MKGLTKHEDTLSTMSSPRPYDEVEDEASVAKGLALLQAHPEKDPSLVFRNVPFRSSLHKLSLPFAAVTETEESVPTSFRLRKQQVLEDGCYLIYDNASGGTLVLHYSHKHKPENAVGFWAPLPDSHTTIQEFKYDQAGGYVELIRGIVGGKKNKRKYYSGWCQFIQMAKSLSGHVSKNPHFEQGLNVDVYGYHDGRVSFLDLDKKLQDVSYLEAVAVVPAGNERFKGVHAMPAKMFLEIGNVEGASLHLHD